MSQLNGKAFVFDTFVNANTARYIGPSNSAIMHDYIDLTRTPRAAKDSKVKSTFRRVKTVADAEGNLDDIIIRGESSHPKFALQTEVDDAVDDVKALTADPAWGDLVWKHDLNADFETA